MAAEVTPEQLLTTPPFAAYRALLLEWNERFNLTAIRDPAEIDRRLLLDSLRMLPTIDVFLASRDQTEASLIDIGSGAGLPGIPLKLARPQLQVTLVEATQKKVTFLQQVIASLSLGGIVAVHGRAEELGRDAAYREQFDLATARAVAALPVLLELTAPLVRVGGQALFPKSVAIDDELEAGERAAPLVGIRIDRSDVLPGGSTRLVVVEKTNHTPRRYPRRAGIPAHDPLGRKQP